MKKHSYLQKYLFYTLVWILASCSSPQKENTPPDIPDESEITPVKPLTREEMAENKRQTERRMFELLLSDSITKDFLTGKVNRKNYSLLVKVEEEHTERNIYLLTPVYEAFKAMYLHALKDGVKLKITSGHRTYVEQVCEWELRWNKPRNEVPFASNLEKVRFLLQYRSMPGTSRHHWGTDMDLNSFKTSYFETAEGKKMYDWLSKNAHNYGFYQPYTAFDEERSTGYNEEKWHWSYRPIAEIMLEKYLELITIDDIKGFKGDQAVKHLDIINGWVCGINKELMASPKELNP